MTTVEVLRARGLPLDIALMIDKFVTYRGPPDKIDIIDEFLTSDIVALCDDIALLFDYRRGKYTFYNVSENKTRPAPSTGFKLTANSKYYLMEMGQAKLIDINTGEINTTEFDIFNQTDRITLPRYGKVTVTSYWVNKLYYFPSAGLFAASLIEENGTIVYVTGQRYIVVDPDPDMILVDADLHDDIYVGLHKNFAIMHDVDKVTIIFKDFTTVYGKAACKFDEESVLYNLDDKIYYRKLGCDSIEINWPSYIDLNWTVIAGDNVIFNGTGQCTARIGKIKYD